MSRRLLAFDWDESPLGPIESWPQSLKAAVAACLHSRFQMAIYWGPELICIYNDAERDVLGGLHPAALGMPAHELLRDSWEQVGPQLRAVMQQGAATWTEDAALTFARRGSPEIGYFTYSYSPIVDERGDVGGVLLVSQETTARVLAERRLDVLRELSTRSMDARTPQQACELAAEALEGRRDFSFTLLYLLRDRGSRAVCTAISGPRGVLEPSHRDVAIARSGNPLERAFEQLVTHRSAGTLLDWSLLTESREQRRSQPRRVFVTSISQGRSDPVAGFLVAGLHDEFIFDSAQQGFLEMVALGIGRTIGAARSRELEQERARATAALARAKSSLFSNTSHELRTPLALILGHLDELLEDADLPGTVRERLAVARRNAARMLKLVGSMLDFSQLEAGRRSGAFRATDLARLTADLAAMFTSAANRAGLQLSVDCPRLAQHAYVDREAWERIVSNLLSNALKFTPAGAIDVQLRDEGASFVLNVSDTGIGIGQEDLDEIFSRFHRGTDPRARTREGMGIGLALVRELVGLHGGTITASNRPGRGTSVTVRIPAGRGHLAASSIVEQEDDVAVGQAAALFVDETAGWLIDEITQAGIDHPMGAADAQPGHAGGRRRDRVLVVEDNADMRDYLGRLLRPHFAVDVARSGIDALEKAVLDPPSILLSDVMVPGLDGLGLVQAIRAEPRTRDTPVMLISARADSQSRLDAISCGADDYVVKPFVARELVARLRATLESAQLRAEGGEARGREHERTLREEELRALLEDLRAAQRRVAAAADAERRRVERDLHDGAQQRLMAIRLELGLLGERLERDPAGARAEVERLHGELYEALEELRELAHGLYPPVLASDGLHAALVAATVHTAIPVRVVGHAIDRVPRPLESAVYFACLEAIQNAVKHGGAGTRAVIRLGLSREELTFSVDDDGVGFEPRTTARGQGLVNLHDRLGAVGGSVQVTSLPGRGTTVAGRVPLPWAEPQRHAGDAGSPIDRLRQGAT